MLNYKNILKKICLFKKFLLNLYHIKKHTNKTQTIMAQFENYEVAYATILEKTENRIQFLINKIKEYDFSTVGFAQKMRAEVELNTLLRKKLAIKNLSELTAELGFDKAKKDLLRNILDINIKNTSTCIFEKIVSENTLNSLRELYSEIEEISVKS